MEHTKRMRDVRSLTLDDIKSVLADLNQPAFRAKQIYEWIFSKNVCSFDEMTNVPKTLRDELSQRFAFGVPKEIVKQVSRDGSRKYLLEFPDGTSVETVGMPSRNKLSVCVSTQAGCAMGCVFCATGFNGLARSLSAQEIVDQVHHVARDFGERVTSVVFMGQGEPFANFENTVAALRMLNDPKGVNISGHVISRSQPVVSSLESSDLPSFLNNSPLQFPCILPSSQRATNSCRVLRNTLFSAFMRPCSPMWKRLVVARATSSL